MLGSVQHRSTTPLSHLSGAGAAAASAADSSADPCAITSRKAEPVDNSAYDAGQAELTFFTDLRAAHASPSEHMPEFHPRLTADLDKATDAILANNPSHETKIAALKAEIEATNTHKKLNLPHVLYFYFKIAALCSQLEEKDGKKPLDIPFNFNAPFKNTFFQEYALSDDAHLEKFTYDEYVTQYPAGSQKDLLTNINEGLWPIPFFGENAEFGMKTYNTLLQAGFFPIGFPIEDKTPDGEHVHPLGFAIHDFSHLNIMHLSNAQCTIDRKIELMRAFAKKIDELAQQQDLFANDIKTIYLIAFIITHEVSGGTGITEYFDHDGHILTQTDTDHLISTLTFSFIGQELEMITPFIETFKDAGYEEKTKIKQEGRERDLLGYQFDKAVKRFMALLFPEK